MAGSPENECMAELGQQLIYQRGRAIEAYSHLEQYLARLLASLLGTTGTVAGVVFFQIVNTRARNEIIDSLFRLKFGANHNLFRNSLNKFLAELDGVRNRVVHWVSKGERHVGESGTTEAIYLVKPNIWLSTDDSIKVSFDDIEDFIAKCRFLMSTVSAFQRVILKEYRFGDATLPAQPEEHDDAWLDIFQRAVVYPPPHTHPLSPNYKKPGTPPPTSPPYG
jgi:hypothetical protein